MTQAAVNRYKVEQMFKQFNSIACQTGEDTNEYVFYLTDTKTIKLYYSQVYKENVFSFNLSSSKSFIMNKRNWNKFKQLLPLIQNFFDNEI